MTKREAKAIAKREKRERRQRWWRETRCYWTPPFRHWYRPWQDGDTFDTGPYSSGCVGCGHVPPQF